MIHEWEVLLRIFLAILAGGVIGLEREFKGHPAGIRTHILLTLGSALIMLISIHGFEGFPQRDPARLAAQVVSGIGFLCAGTIMRTGGSVHGLTSAASLWVSGGIGLAIGSGYYFGALITTALVFLVLFVLARIQDRFFFRQHLILVIESDRTEIVRPIAQLLTKNEVDINDITIEKPSEKERLITYYLTTTKRFERNPFIEQVSQLDGVRHSSWQDLY